jgi:endonuclease/exonuclease/phosphatase family metal-dependent hydrolase
MKDAFSEKGKGFGKTYVNNLGFFRIDNILFESKIKINSYKTIQKKLSDHYPVVVTFDLQ